MNDAPKQTTQFDTGSTSWALTTSTLIFFMTVPGLALYYGGMVKAQQVLHVALQTITITCVITFMWLAVGYSLCFAPVTGDLANNHSVIGDGSRLWLLGLTINSFHDLAPNIPETVFCIRELTFAIITPALMSGSFASRLKFNSMVVFIMMWHVFVYCPLAHVLWHPGGFLFKLGTLDYAGGNVVHLASGMASLACAVFLGSKGLGNERFEPHNILLTVMGASMMWVGWYGFNAGSAYNNLAGGQAGYAMLSTQICSSMSALTWMLTECYIHDYPTVLGLISGAIAGLVVITPAAGYVDQTGAFVMGTLSGPLCYFGVQLKHQFGFEDALDAFGTHAVGGLLGGLLTGLFARREVGGVDGSFYGNSIQFAYQLAGVSCTSAYAFVVTGILLVLVESTIGLRAIENENDNDLDASIHGGSASGSINGRRLDDIGSSFNGRSSHLSPPKIKVEPSKQKTQEIDLREMSNEVEFDPPLKDLKV